MTPTKLHKLIDPDVRRKNVQALNYRLRGAYWQLARPTMPDPVFVVGCSRAGTTVTYETLSASPHLLSFGYELPQLWHGLHGPAHNNWQSEAAGADDAQLAHRNHILRYFYERLGQGRVLDKSCINVMRIPYLRRIFPRATFIYIHRDGRDNVSSLMEGWRQRGRFDLYQYLGPLPAEVRINNGEFTDWCFFLPPGWRDYNTASLEHACAYQWIVANRMALAAKSEMPAEQWIQMRYEDIFERPTEMFRHVFHRLGIPFDEELRKRCETLNSRPTSIINGAPRQAKWREQNPEAIRRIIHELRPLMHELGYGMGDMRHAHP